MMGEKKQAGNGQDASRSTLTRVFLENSTFLKKYLNRFLSEQQDIEDVVQETYLRAYCAERKKRVNNPKSFLFRIARNVALNELSRKSRQLTDYIEDLGLPIVIDTEKTIETEFEALEQLGVYCEAVATLPNQCRRVYLLRKVHGLSHKEIAARMGLTISSVEKHLLKGTLRCRAYVQQHEQSQPGATCTSGTKVAVRGRIK